LKSGNKEDIEKHAPAENVARLIDEIPNYENPNTQKTKEE
jgi:hypothetical protein